MGYIPHFGLYSIFFWVMGYIQFGLYSIWVVYPILVQTVSTSLMSRLVNRSKFAELILWVNYHCNVIFVRFTLSIVRNFARSNTFASGSKILAIRPFSGDRRAQSAPRAAKLKFNNLSNSTGSRKIEMHKNFKTWGLNYMKWSGRFAAESSKFICDRFF